MSVDFLAHIVSESARFADVLRDADPTAQVPSCPDWTAADLAWHLTEVHAFWATIVRERLDSPEAAEAAAPPRPGNHAEVLELYARATEELVEVLSTTPDDVPVWTWGPRAADESVGFVRRFQAHEALMHRLDAELTTGAVTPLDPQLASDGMDVVVRFCHSWRPAWSTWVDSEAVGVLRASDTGAELTVMVGGFSGTSPDTGKVYDAEPTLMLVDSGAPTFEVSAPAADLDAWLWNRPGFAAPVVTGSEPDFARLAAKIAAGVP